MKRSILFLQILLTAFAASYGQSQLTVKAQGDLPQPSKPVQPLNVSFQQYLQQNYKQQGINAAWQNTAATQQVTRSLGAGPDAAYLQLAYRHDFWSGQNSDWDATDSALYSYFDNGNVNESTNLLYNSPNWNNFYKLSYTYTQNGAEETYINQAWRASTGNWVNISKIVYDYDAQNHCTSMASSSFDSTTGNWIRSNKFNYGYDASGNRTGELYQTWADEGGWGNQYEYTYTYDSLNNKTGYISQVWKNGNWVNNQSGTFTYNSSGKLTSQNMQTWTGGNWVNYSNNTWAFDGNNNLIQTIQQFWITSNNAWVNIARSDYNYDGNNNNTLEVDYTWNAANTVWDSSAKKAFSYNANNYPLGETDAVYSNSTFNYTTKYVNEYNGNNNKLSTTNYVYNKSSGWTAVNMFSYTYDANNNVVYQLDQNWNTSSSAFVNSEQYYFYYTAVKATAINETTNTLGADIYPNPSASSQVNLHLSVTRDSEVQINVYDALGRPVSVITKPVIDGDNSITLGSMEMAAGNYFVQLIDRTSGQTSVLKFIKL